MKNEKSTLTRNKWQKVCEDWGASGLSPNRYCTEKGRSLERFYYWRKKLNYPIPSDYKSSISDREIYAHHKWQMICEDWQKSGLSGQKYCKEKRIHEADFYKWRKKIEFPVSIRPNYRMQNWREILKDWEISGLHPKQYCEEKNISIYRFYRWRSKTNHPAYITLKERANKWREILKDWETSGLGINMYCRKNALNPTTLLYWEKKLDPHKIKQTIQQKAVERWKRIFEDFKKSGLSGLAYCQRRGVAGASFYKWKRRLNYSAPQLGLNLIKQERPKIALEDYFVSISFGSAILMGSPPPSTKIDIMLSQRHRLCIEGQVNWKGLNAWLALLSQSKLNKEKEV